MTSKPKIETAYYSEDWNFENGDPEELINNSAHITASEFDPAMAGHVFCPVCKTPLTRVPKSGLIQTNNVKAYFRHLPSYKSVKCKLRTPESEGKRYKNEEDAKEAIEKEELIIISKFTSEPVETNSDRQAEPYDATAVEDEEGELTEVPIARHRGEKLNLPTRITSVQALCTNFDKKFYSYILFPGKEQALMLKDILINIKDINKEKMEELDADEEQAPQLYYGEIQYSRFLGESHDDYLRMTLLKCHESVHDFCIKIKSKLQDRRGIHEKDASKGRIVIFWGIIKESGFGFAVKPLWGEFGLLPEKYNKFLK
ncbi:hypothetical protein [Acinetobacter sp. yr461]|uniref:hypothetical protein n=1 Tax=Acinetobacter sp. yr461 TaxID=1761742 RepID=UPI0008B417B3|nr:hypothetical protein [Acinetobacter sp. yr461]SEO13234.1 hypothetical protein SAMN04487817_101557 [Acinetobacter sp. yr461]